MPCDFVNRLRDDHGFQLSWTTVNVWTDVLAAISTALAWGQGVVQTRTLSTGNLHNCVPNAETELEVEQGVNQSRVCGRRPGSNGMFLFECNQPTVQPGQTPVRRHNAEQTMFGSTHLDKSTL